MKGENIIKKKEGTGQVAPLFNGIESANFS